MESQKWAQSMTPASSTDPSNKQMADQFSFLYSSTEDREIHTQELICMTMDLIPM